MNTDQVFCLRGADGQPEWKAMLNGEVLPTEWSSKGAALAGLEVERRRKDEHLRDIARGGIEQHLGDVCDAEASADALYDEAFTLAHDALLAAGIDAQTATRIASEEARNIAQP
jgi:hypothetical protein